MKDICLNTAETTKANNPRRRLRLLFVFMSFIFMGSINFSGTAISSCGCSDGFCSTADCSAASNQLEQYHDDLEQHTEDEFDDDLEAFEDWMVENFFEGEVAPAMAMMTTQMSAVMMQQAQIIGAFLDADTQLDTQRLFQQLQAEAHKDYRPSDDFCWFGTNVRSLANSESRGRLNTVGISQTLMARQLGNANMAGAGGVENDLRMRWAKFVNTYCDIKDNNWLEPTNIPGPAAAPASGQLTGLEFACDHDGNITGGGNRGATDPWRTNIDVDYTRLIEEPRTLEVNFTAAGASDDKEDVLALSKNLYGHRVLSRELSRQRLQGENASKLYLALRSVEAKRSVAEHSYESIVGLKSQGTGAGLIPVGQTRQYLAAIVKQLMPTSMTDEEIYELIGEEPSYFAQLEILAKKLYQNPDFYANLYDTPANVDRKYVAMKAIELMLDRAIYESQVRREMSVSVLLSTKLRDSQRVANEGLSGSTGADLQ